VTKLIVRRLLALPIILLVVAAVTFGMMAVSGIDPVNAYVNVENGVSQQARDEIARSWGVDEPIYQQFGRWLGNLVQGDLGNSISKGGQPVAGEIASRLAATSLLVGGALVLTLVGGLAFGVLAAAFRGTWFDWVVRALCFFNVAAPGFWIGYSRCICSRSSSGGCRRAARRTSARPATAAWTSSTFCCRCAPWR